MKKQNGKPFDIGIYTFKRQVMGAICPEDDQKMKNGSVVAVLHPMQTVDPGGIYCFGVDKDSGDTKVLCKKNLRFSKAITLSYTPEPLMTAHQETWVKLNAVLTFLKTKAKQLAL